MDWTGGCLCGAIRYRSTSDPSWVGHCHCTSCQRWTGSAAFTGACFAPEDLEWTRGEPKFYQSSKDVQRSFCPNCASPLAFHRADVRVAVTAGTLDNPEMLKPEFHMFAEHEHSWARTGDGLPRQEGFLPEDSQFEDPDQQQ
jgi:hypothetical protein